MKLPSSLLLCSLLLWGCPAGGAGDDDDIAGDDDDLGDDDVADDDDATGFEFAELTMRGELTVLAADDDDVADDDDSANDAPGDDDSAVSSRDVASADGSFVFAYWRDVETEQLECEQLVEWTGEVEFAAGVVADCAGCTGVLRVEASSVVDASNRALDPDACDPAELALSGRDFGATLTASGASPAGGGLLEITLIDLDAALALGLTPTQAGDDLSLAAERDRIASIGGTLTHVGFVSSAGGTFFDQIDFENSAGLSGPGEPWTMFWYVFRLNVQNPHDGPDLNGSYRLGSFWILQ